MKYREGNPYGRRERVLVYDLDGCVVDSSARLKRCVDVEAMRRGDVTSYTWSFYDYGLSTEGDVPIVQGITAIQALAQAYRIDRLIALTSRGNTGRKPTVEWMRRHLPWEMDGKYDLIMHQELHYGLHASAYGAQSFDSECLNIRCFAPGGLVAAGKPLRRDLVFGVARGYGHGQFVEPWDLTKDLMLRGDAWFLPVRSGAERFSPSMYKREVIEVLNKECDVVLAIDDHPEVITTYQEMGLNAMRFVFAGIDCLTPAGDPKE